MAAKTYIGDGAYAEFDGFSLILTTENGIATQNRIYLEPEVLRALLVWLPEHFKSEWLASAVKRES